MFLVLRKHSFIGETIAHTSFFGVIVSLLLGFSPYLGAIISSLISSQFILFLRRKINIYRDALLSVVSLTGIGLSILLIRLLPGAQSELWLYMFGDILSISYTDVYISIFVLIITSIFIYIFYSSLILISFNKELACSQGVKVAYLDSIFFAISSIIIVSAMKIVGLLLTSAFLVFPVIISLLFKKGFNRTLFVAIVISIFSTITSLIISFQFNLIASGVFVFVYLCILISVLFLNKFKL